MKVILDTTILHADPFFRKTEMLKFRELCNKGKIELIIPRIILREFITQEQEKASITGKKVLNDLNKYCGNVYGQEKNALTETIEKTKIAIAEADRIIQKKVDAFIFETHANIIDATIDEYNEMLDLYFRGDKPFKYIKSREDIPDGIIFAQTINIKDEVVFITKDNNLREAVKNKKIQVFEKLTDFIASSEIKEISEIKEVDDLLYYRLPSMLENKMLLEKFYNTFEEEILFKKFTDEKIPDDNNEGTISGVMGIDPIEFIKDGINKLGTGLFTIPFYCEIDASIEYYFFKADYCSLDEERISDIYIENWNEHYYQAEEEFPLICTGQLGIQFNCNISNEEFLNSSNEKLIDKIKISFSETRIQVKEF